MLKAQLFIIDFYLFRQLLVHVYIPVVRKELDVFRECVWNNHRNRKQRDKELPAGIPNHNYRFPEKYDGDKCGLNIAEKYLVEVDELSGMLENTDDYLESAVRTEC